MTEEQLKEIEVEGIGGPLVYELIAALRASQAEVAELKSAALSLASMKANYTMMKGELESARDENVKLREALELAPVHITKDGVWWNFRPDPTASVGMVQVTGNAETVVKTWHKRVLEALAQKDEQDIGDEIMEDINPLGQ